MRILYYIPGLIATFALIVILLITSVEAVVYWTPDYFEKEYEKYRVTEDVAMKMTDLLTVTEHMMNYLRGDEEELQITTVIAGKERNFFSSRELAHMVDVKNLLLGGLALRKISILVLAASVTVLAAGRHLRVLLQGILVGTGIFLSAICLLFVVASTDFTKYFTLFHRIFFDNDLWILDPDTDLLINIVPEPFFIDTAARIGVLFAVSLAAVMAVCLLFLIKSAKLNRNCLFKKKVHKEKGKAGCITLNESEKRVKTL